MAMATGRITKKLVDATVSVGRETFVWDTDVKGFGLRVTAKGARTYLLQYRMGGREVPTRRYTIGSHGSPWTPDTARQRALDLLADIRKGVDPQHAEQTKRNVQVDLAFDTYVDRFIERYAKREQRRSWKQADQCLRNHAIPYLRSKALPSITRRELAALMESVEDKTPALARYLHATLRRLFRWAVERGDLDHSPMVGMSPPSPIAARERVLSDAELVAIWNAAGELGHPFGPMFRLLIVTGQRREEVGGMRWAEVDLNVGLWTIPSDRSKNGRAHIVPLSRLASESLTAVPRMNSEFVFSTTGSTAPSGWSKAKARLDAIVDRDAPGVVKEPWRSHDLRRTLATGLQRLGVRFEVTEAVLNHVGGSRSGVAGVYQRHNWAEEKRTALERWGRSVEAFASGQFILGGFPDDTVVALPARAVC